MKKYRKWLAIGIVICLAAGTVGGVCLHRKELKEKRLSLIYIPKVVDGTNDFWTSLIQGARIAAKEYNSDISFQFVKVPYDIEKELEAEYKNIEIYNRRKNNKPM